MVPLPAQTQDHEGHLFKNHCPPGRLCVNFFVLASQPGACGMISIDVRWLQAKNYPEELLEMAEDE